ncbi:hypothetical protein HY640_03525 [Candidatus Woesearchaeota archaeon]|nr:hypothetical protein [Candidatus Woesearchaeota archaeon]
MQNTLLAYIVPRFSNGSIQGMDLFATRGRGLEELVGTFVLLPNRVLFKIAVSDFMCYVDQGQGYRDIKPDQCYLFVNKVGFGRGYIECELVFDGIREGVDEARKGYGWAQYQYLRKGRLLWPK